MKKKAISSLLVALLVGSVLGTLIISAGNPPSSLAGERERPAVSVGPEVQGVSWNAVDSFADQLQNINLTVLGKTKFNLIIIDYSSDGTEAGRFTAAQINALKNSPGGPKLVLAYLSIGEADNFRWYWNDSWTYPNGTLTPQAPPWLGPPNPAWPGSYEVRYWEPGWQKIVFQYLDKIIAAGFDGVYLDVIDAYLYWGPGGEGRPTRTTAAQDMVNLVEEIAHRARATKDKPGFGIFPNNGAGLSSYPDYVQTVTGIGEESTWYNGNTRQPSAGTSRVITNLDLFKSAGKLVLCIDYVTIRDLIDDFYSRAIDQGFVPYATVSCLCQLTINPGHEPGKLVTRLSGTASTATPSVGQLYAIDGRLTSNGKALAKVNVTLQESADNMTWANVAQARTNANGYYQFNNNETAAGLRYYRARYPGNATYTASTSPGIKITVTKELVRTNAMLGPPVDNGILCCSSRRLHLT